MKKSTFAAQVALLNHRWPWPTEAEEARKDYEVRLWAKCEPWQKEMTDAFCGAVEQLVSRRQQFGRPTAQEVVNLAFERVRGAGGHDSGTPAADLERERERRYREWNEDWERRRADPVEREEAIASSKRGLVLWRPGSKEREHMIAWLQTFWDARMTDEECAELLSRPRMLVKDIAKPVDPEVAAAAPSAAQVARGEAKDAGYKERVREAVKDWRDEQTDDFEGEVPF